MRPSVSSTALQTIRWTGDSEGRLSLIDQTRLPLEVVEVECADLETVWEAIKMLLRPGQQQALQDQLHFQALKHLSTAMEFANKANEGALVVGAAQRFWRHCKSFADSDKAGAGLLSQLRQPVGLASQQLEALEAALQPQVLQLRVRLYEVLLAVLADAGAWAEGLSLLQRAFVSLPESTHEPLWEQKVRFMCKGGGKSLSGEMYKLKDFSPTVQARVWAVMGANSEGKGEQLTALLRAADALGSDPLQKVEYQITLAEWLFCNDFPSQV